MTKARDIICSALSAALGVWAFTKTQSVTKEAFDPIVAACTAKAGEETGYDLVPFEPLLGGPFICIITQFVYRLVENAPAGLMMWGATIACALPVGILCNVEAGRSGAKGPVRFPTVLGLIAIFVAISVSFPLLFVPSFLLLGGSRTGAVLPRRAYAALYLSLPGFVLTIMAFVLDPSSYSWTLTAGLLGGPAIVLTTLLLWGMEPKGNVGPEDIARGAIATSNAYIGTSIMAFIFWFAVMRASFMEYGLDIFALWDGIWVDADPCVKFMTIDAGVLFLSVLLYIASVDPMDAFAALLVSPLLGPGTSCGMMLWGHERVRTEKAKAIMQQQKKEKSK